jgi:hypothetical protein
VYAGGDGRSSGRGIEREPELVRRNENSHN